MPKEETIELRHIRNTIGEREDLPSLNARSSLTSRVRSLITKFFGVPQLVHLYGALGINKTLTLDAATGENRVRSLFSDGTYLYAGLSPVPGNPGKIVKIDLATFTSVSTLTLAAGEEDVTSLVSDGTSLYAGLYTTPGKIVKIDLATFTSVSTLTLAAGEDLLHTLVSDGTSLYAGLFTTSGKIVKISLDTFTSTSTLTLAAGENKVFSLFLDGNFLYAGLYTSPGYVVKISLDTFASITTLTMSDDYITSLFSDGIYLYAGSSDLVLPHLFKIDLDTFTEIESVSTTYYIYSIFSDGTYLYAGGTSPLTSAFLKISITPFKLIYTTTTSSTVYSTFSDGTYLYYGIYTSPGQIIREYIIPSADIHQRKIDISKECIQSVVSATTSLGLATTLIDTARTEGDDYWNNMTVLILGGEYKGQSRRISDFDAATDTITVSPAFNGAIASGVRYAILPNIESGTINNLIATKVEDSYSHLNNTNEQDVLIFNATMQDVNTYLDMSNITQTSTIREYLKLDDVNYRQLTAKVFPTDFDTSTKSISISFKQPNKDYKVTLQSSVAEGSAKAIFYVIRTEPRS